jgi:dTDP-4-amino-4,6-dideoxygalactose transaminase
VREHGQRAKYEHEREGWTARLDTIQAIVLSAKLERLDAWNDERRKVAAHYLEHLAGVGDLELPPVAPDSDPVWHLFVVRTADPEALGDALKANGIATGRHYPDAVHLTEAYRWLGYEPGAFPIAERHAGRVLSLPVFPGMTMEAAEAVVAGVSSFFDGD